MASSASPLMRILSACLTSSVRAGVIVREIMQMGNLGIVDKGINDLQTEADRSAQKCIVASLQKRFTKLRIIGEEGDADAGDVPSDWIVTKDDQDVLRHQSPEEHDNLKEEDLVVWVDPLDGTAEYTQGLLDHVTILVGISHNGSSLAGVIHQPYYNYEKAGATLGRTIWGLRGLGSFGYDSSARPPANQNIVATTRSHVTGVVKEAVDACEPSEVWKVGGSGHKVLLVLDGLVHAYVFASPGTKKWDTCAPEAVLRAAGGSLTDIRGQEIRYDDTAKSHRNHQGVLATLHVDHTWYVRQIPDSIKDAMSL